MVDIDRESLFKLCFGDTNETVREFYSISEVYTVSEYENGRLCAMANLLPVSAGDIKGFYAYAVCVHPKFRGKGYFRSVMKKSEEYAIERGARFLCLIPASDELVRSYGRMGYTKIIENSPERGGIGVGISVDSEGFIGFCADGYGGPHTQSGLAKSLVCARLPEMFFISPMGDT